MARRKQLASAVAVRGSFVNDSSGLVFAYAIFVLSGDHSGNRCGPGVSTVKGVVPLESMIQMSGSFVPVRSTTARRPSRDRATFQGPVGLVAAPSVLDGPAGPVEPRQLGWPWRHPFGTRSFPWPKRIRRHAQRTRHRHGFGTVTGSPESIRRAGSNRRATRAPWRANSRRNQTAQKHRMCRRRSAVSCPANRASRDRSRGHRLGSGRVDSEEDGLPFGRNTGRSDCARLGPGRGW